MTSKEILQKYIDFYTERGHKQISNMSLVPENDPTLLFVNSGMFPLVPYLSGNRHPLGKKLVNVQRSLRFDDLENIGDATHTLAFHMIGNWSLGDYFKKKQLPWAYEFFIEQLGLDPHKMYATVFEGDDSAPKDNESIKIIKQIFAKYGIDAKENERIFARGKKDNWWKRGDAVGELGGPDSEIFYYIGKNGNGFGQDPTANQTDFLEIGNSVFMQYKKTATGWEELSQKNVDFGGGLERIALVVQGKQDIYETDNFWPLIEKIQELSGKEYLGENAKTPEEKAVTKSMRILADHMRATTFIAMDGVLPSNKDQGYVLRRLLRRMIRASRVLGVEKDISVRLVETTCTMFGWLYPQLLERQKDIERVFAVEEAKFSKTLASATKYLLELLERVRRGGPKVVNLAEEAYKLYQSLGLPLEIFIEYLRDDEDAGLLQNPAAIQILEEEFNAFIRNHQFQSRKGAEQKFKGGLADQSENTIKYHTATHILQAVLREILGTRVVQKGSNIMGERLRFDFPNETKLTDEQVRKVETRFAQIISKNLPVDRIEMQREKAEKTGALHVFGEKYGDIVSIYYIGKNIENAVSKEFCGGPHVKNTSELTAVKIYKQDNLGSGILRIYAKF